ncbi:restriction endonuclease subunit S [Sphingomonas sp. 2R-10]|uniref:restriction endonuclease subunit S n=1 Tax=Sphingomonas sp. 2R-10 TaxID=3045148 RepID=UPI0019D26368|nr:restriction endonuclease subunit S [Sphingomonas sp. 2R-10]MDJ0275188.1 restriction endonuclease subunit S [Sphingomonas sp. 2R-10]
MSVATSWKTEPLSQVVDFIGGGTPSRAEPSFWGGTIPWATVKDFKSTSLTRTGESITEEGLRSSASRIIKRGTLIMPTRMALGKVAVAEIDVAINQDLKALSPRRPINSRFLLHALLARRSQIEARGNGATVKGITISDLGAISLHYPADEAEQRRIAAILDKADAIRARRRAALADADKFIASAFAHLVGELAPGYEQWPLRTIEQLAEDRPGSMRTGPFGSDLRHSEFTDEGVTVLGIDNAVQNHFAWGERRFITAEKYQKLQRYRVLPGDVIVTIMGTTGRSAVVPDNIPVAISTKHLATISLDREQADPHFVSWALHSAPALRRQIAAANKGAIMDGLNLTIIRGLKIRRPPLPVQQRFAELVRRHYALLEQAGDPVLNGEALYASLATRAFRGEL